MKTFVTTFIALLLSYDAWSQETRPMTDQEKSFYTSTIQLIEDAFPIDGFNNWTTTSKTSAEYYPHIAITRAKDMGPYEHVHQLEYSLPVEFMHKLMDSLAKEMEGVTDINRLNEYASTLENITLSMQLKIIITVNSIHTVMTDRTGKIDYPQFLNQQTKWGSDIMKVAKTYTNKTNHPDGLLVAIGKTNKFEHFPYDSEKGGSVVSATSLPKEKGTNAFKIYNLFIHIQGPHQAGYEFLNKVNWDVLKAAITSYSIN